MKTNRIIASALAFIMATTVSAGSVFAAGETVTLGASTTEVKPGSQFTVDITLADVPATGIMGCEFAVKYDSSVLTITGVEAGEIANTGADSVESDISGECPSFYADYSTDGSVSITWSTGLDDSSYWISQDGTLATITGTVAAGAAAGEYPVEIVPISRDGNTTINVGYIDANNTSVAYDTAVSNGAVIIVAETQQTTTTKPAETTTTGPIVTTTSPSTTETTSKTTNGGAADVHYGDINLDGVVSMVDMVYLNKASAKLVQLNDQQMANADCAFDGSISAADSQALLKFLVLSLSELPVVLS